MGGRGELGLHARGLRALMSAGASPRSLAFSDEMVVLALCCPSRPRTSPTSSCTVQNYQMGVRVVVLGALVAVALTAGGEVPPSIEATLFAPFGTR